MEHLSRENEELSRVQKALDPIATGVYRQCVDCEEEISPKRLKVMPWAIRCIARQQRMEEVGSNAYHQPDGEPLHTQMGS
jgi:RNA polymerase-binding transcription factor DksA